MENNMKTKILSLISLILFLIPSLVLSDPYKILIVMSYEEDNFWVEEMREGIKQILGDNELTFFHMDTKRNIDGGEEKSKEAYDLYLKLQPDGVITADDNAQSMFVLPYLKDKVDTPIVFCGVNTEATKYGFPTSHITGILEKVHIKETLAFLKQLDSSIKTFAFITKDGPSGRSIKRQLESEQDDFIITPHSYHLAANTQQLKEISEKLIGKVDAIFIDALEGIEDENGVGVTHPIAIGIIKSKFKNPIVGANAYHVEHGALAAVVKTGQEQGKTAAEMLLKILEGTPVSEIPVATNYKGQRLLNVKELNRLEINPEPYLFLGTKIIR